MTSRDEQRTALTNAVHAGPPHPQHRWAPAVTAERVTDPGSVEGYVPLDGSVYRGGDAAPAAAEPAEFVVLGTAQ
jgi:hypothetical protein